MVACSYNMEIQDAELAADPNVAQVTKRRRRRRSAAAKDPLYHPGRARKIFIETENEEGDPPARKSPRRSERLQPFYVGTVNRARAVRRGPHRACRRAPLRVPNQPRRQRLMLAQLTSDDEWEGSPATALAAHPGAGPSNCRASHEVAHPNLPPMLPSAPHPANIPEVDMEGHCASGYNPTVMPKTHRRKQNRPNRCAPHTANIPEVDMGGHCASGSNPTVMPKTQRRKQSRPNRCAPHTATIPEVDMGGIVHLDPTHR